MDYISDLMALKQTSMVSDYMDEFKRLSIMVVGVSKKRLTHMCVGGLEDPLKGMVKSFQICRRQ